MGETKIGTTGRGIGPAYEDKIARRAVRVQDLFYPGALRGQARAAARVPQLRPDAVLQARAGVVSQARSTPRSRSPPQLQPMVADVAALLQEARRARRVAAVRRRAGRAARHRSRHLSVRDLVELPRRRGGAGQRHRAAAARLRAGHRQGVHHARGHRSVPDRAHRRHRRAARQARQRVRLGHRPPAPLRLARHSGARALAAVERRRRPVHHQARRARRHVDDPHLHRLHRGAASRSRCCRRAPRRSPSASRSTRTCPAGARAPSASTTLDALPANARAYLRAHRGADRGADRDGIDRPRARRDHPACIIRSTELRTTDRWRHDPERRAGTSTTR